MSSIQTSQQGSARPIGELMGAITRRKVKGDTECPTDPVHRDSYDVDDPRAQPWLERPFDPAIARMEEIATLDAFDAGMKAEAIAKVEARRRCREIRKEGREPTEAEKPMPVEDRLHDLDRRVLAYYLERHRFTKGRAFPTIATVAAALGMAESALKASRRRLKHRGLMNWRRRSRKVPNMDGRPGWHRRQASCVCDFLDVGRRLVGKMREVYLKTCARLRKRVSATPAEIKPQPPAGRLPTDEGLLSALQRIEDGFFPGALGSASP